MRDHFSDSTRRYLSLPECCVRELKANAARILRHVRDCASNILTHRGRAVGVILPLDPIENHLQAADDSDAVAAWDKFKRAGRRRFERRFRPGLSGVRLLSTMRCRHAPLPPSAGVVLAEGLARKVSATP